MRALLTRSPLILAMSALLLTGCPADEDDPTQCLAYPDCGPEATKVDRCDTTKDDCFTATACGTTIYCEEYPDSCTAEPSCPPDRVQMDACPRNGADCQEVTTCGKTIFCVEDVQCGAVPVCEDGWMQIDGCADEPGLVECKEVTVCGSTIFCAREVITCDAEPVCPPGSEPVPDNDPRCQISSMQACFPVEACGKTLWCAKNTCEPVEAKGVGDCDRYFGTAFNGAQCEAVSGCTCEGPGCNQLYPDTETCARATRGCGTVDPLCADRSDVEFLYTPGGPICDGPDVFRYVYNGQFCEPRVQGCGAVCVGDDCDAVYPDMISCVTQVSQFCNQAGVCHPQEAKGEGNCRAVLGFAHDGASCQPVTGCQCVGPDCAALYPSMLDCEKTHGHCKQEPWDPCKPMEAEGVGFCDLFLGFAFDGAECRPLSGCSCEGPDCGKLYMDPETCFLKHEMCVAPPTCQGQSAFPIGACGLFLGYAFTGMSCQPLSGCSCQGDDCDNLYMDLASCKNANAQCLQP